MVKPTDGELSVSGFAVWFSGFPGPTERFSGRLRFNHIGYWLARLEPKTPMHVLNVRAFGHAADPRNIDFY